MSHAAPAVEDATRLQPAAPNWGAAEQIAHYIERMVYERERNRLSVRLDPPELGVVELRIRATGGEVQAWLTAERDLTRQMLQQAQQYLREQLESRGLQLTHFDVGTQSQFHHAPREQRPTDAAPATPTRTLMATDSLLHDGRWSVWV
jgi:flagellar hook-length control protein FliK